MLGVIIFNMRLQFKSAENLQKEQNLEDAFVKFSAPALEKKTLNEKNLKDMLKDDAEKVSVYGIFTKKMEYSVFYTRYVRDFDLRQSADNFINLFADFNFLPERTESENKITLNGKFARENQILGTAAVFIKKGKNLWQVFAVYPYSQENENEAQRFINSVETDPSNKLQGADKTK
jgi:hypothetical protein